MIDAEERRQVVEVANDTERPFSDDRCLHELFEERVARHPERTRSGHHRPLMDVRRTRHLGRARRARPASARCRARTRWSVCTPRHSAEMVAGILGALKAGGAYMPIEPSYPGGPPHRPREPAPASPWSSPSPTPGHRTLLRRRAPLVLHSTAL
ncbi:hypothetical protein LV779_14875 [Streptomyces thinghirensis]|nr:hypothetical protein [Streptomyces thinghirensis]